MEEFIIFLKLGFDHITDLNGYDHLLFIVALCAIYDLNDWKKVLVSITAFTVGHSITLALSVLNLVHFSTDLIEFLIPVTIMITCIGNLFLNKGKKQSAIFSLRYPTTLFFGLIHGLGFSNYLRSLLGNSNSIVSELLAFNLGLEFGQILIVLVFLLINYIFIKIIKVQKVSFVKILSAFLAGITFTLIIDKWIF
jgi:hypothetical protein